MIQITLSNGLRVGNFSSPHEFKFTDGSVLPAVSAEEAERLKVTFIEQNLPIPGHLPDFIRFVKLSFDLSLDVKIRMVEWYKKCKNGHVDVVLCPLPMLQALHPRDFKWGELLRMGVDLRLLDNPIVIQDINKIRNLFVSVRIDNRIEKLVSTTKFTVI